LLSIDPSGGLNVNLGKGPNPLSTKLNVVSKCIKAGVPTRMYMVALGGFDTHADERGTQEDLLKVVDEALTSFLRDRSSDNYGKNVVVLMYS
jgi:uncharacterized protein (DUF1501 family)